MRILVYNWRDLAHPRAGGAEVYTHNVAREWVAAGHDVTLFTSTVEGRPAAEEVDGITIVRRGGRLGVYREARRFYQREGKSRFDAVIDEVNTRPFLCPTFVRDVPVMALIHQVAREVWFYETPLPVALVGRYWLEPRWLRHYRDVPTVTISESSRESLVRYGLRNVTVVPVGVTVPERDRDLPEKEHNPTVVFVGRLSANKRPLDAIRAWELASRELPELQLWIVGTGPLEEELRRRASKRVHFFGHVPNEEKFDLMARAHAIVATSVREGWGMTITEAAAVGTPAIAYDVPGLRDSVRSCSGKLTAPCIEALAGALVRRFRQPVAVSEPLVEGLATWKTVGSSWGDILERAVAPSMQSLP